MLSLAEVSVNEDDEFLEIEEVIHGVNIRLDEPRA